VHLCFLFAFLAGGNQGHNRLIGVGAIEILEGYYDRKFSRGTIEMFGSESPNSRPLQE
jgi:hypothetical protein